MVMITIITTIIRNSNRVGSREPMGARTPALGVKPASSVQKGLFETAEVGVASVVCVRSLGFWVVLGNDYAKSSVALRDCMKTPRAR